MESTLGKECIEWAQLEAVSGNKGMYSSVCSKECAKFSESYNTCIDHADKVTRISKLLSKYRGD
jgi:hypothetical protein